MIQHMALIFGAAGLSGPEKLLLLALTNHTDAHGYCHPGIPRLMDETGKSKNSILRARESLTGKGVLKAVKRRNARGQDIPNLYRVNLALLATMQRPRRTYDDNLIEEITFAPPGGGPNLTPPQTDESHMGHLEGPNLEPSGSQSGTPGGPNLAPPGGANLAPKSSYPSEQTSFHPPVAQPASVMEEAEEEAPSAGEDPADERGDYKTPRDGEAAAIVDGLPAVHGRRVNRAQRPQLVSAVAERLGQGWTAEDLRAELTRDLGTAQGAGVFFHRLTSLPDVPPAVVVSKPVPSMPAPRAPEVKPHPWVDGGPNGACLTCGRSQLADVHQEHQEQARRSVRRCEHGRVIHVCPTCRGGAAKAPETAGEPQTAPSGGSAMDPRLSGLLSAVAATSARR